ncbi:MAG: segregation/condensation protein A [Deltaproteobacteria bacterium]|jgi:segregation and condensation protein A|nr:segregation/condensation protein A [Deltaproteobacteria bacterium]
MLLDNDGITLKLDIYEGPLDLLLHLIKRNEVDIHDIPVSLITAQYLEYIEMMESLNLDLAGDFLIMAATLTHIQSKMLLPAAEVEPGGPAVEDPRMELVKPLLEHAAFLAAAEALGSRPQLDRDVFARGGEGLSTLDLPAGGKLPRPEQRIAKSSSFELVKAWHHLLSLRASEGMSLSFHMETVTIGERLGQIRRFLLEAKAAHFRELLVDGADSFELALSLLAILELARTGFLRLFQDHELDPSGPRLFLADPSAQASPESLDYR